MGTVRKTITVTDQQDSWIKAQIDAGRYTNDSEYIRDLIRREQERSAEIEGIRQALIEGEASGEPRRFSVDEFKKRMLSAHD
ncbi:type II toxin-antitoxin system ParD family antitoxin [Pseudomonas viridiflava]|uniref:type II toxin-antitoxin system ParD family antitoxin n=1 Tax=Pseudomonas viridiflava TaxID=33069 RepID=UPI0018E5EE04|nr:type II toxin-antitoxin system ParD family antitoxin [Pseudomonas viridiflava]MBI6702798.1 type II toxin-antitoxin system ParD family antitoxin [Pseudomonas viridiflava]MBI6725092.1 type II toxin-antitoxin system ParD family antitoxin [Pseudomonas viridiflava]